MYVSMGEDECKLERARANEGRKELKSSPQTQTQGDETSSGQGTLSMSIPSGQHSTVIG